MQGRKLISLSTVMLLLALCFLSTPGFAGDHPWDIDNGGDSKDITNTGDVNAAQGIPVEKGVTVPPTTASSVSVGSNPVMQVIVDYVFRSWNVYGSALGVDDRVVSNNRRWSKRSSR